MMQRKQVKKEERVKVLHVLGGLFCGGSETFVMNMFRESNPEKIQFEFLIHEKSKSHYDDEVLTRGGTIYRIPDRTEVGIVKYFIILIKTLITIKPDIIHTHAMFNGGAVILAAFIAGIKKRVCHSHSSDDQRGTDIFRTFFRFIIRILIKLFATDFAACNEDAANYLYGEKMVKRGQVTIINNGVDFKKYHSIKKNKIDLLRRELGIDENHLVIGYVGRLVDVKNPLFLLPIYFELLKYNPHMIFVFAGEGPLKQVIVKEFESRGVVNNLRMLGNRLDIPDLMGVFDVFLLPSIFEGAPIVAIEAQAKSLPCLVSTGIPKSIDLGLGLVRFLPLDKEDLWIKAIKTVKKPIIHEDTIRRVFGKKGYDIASTYTKLMYLYGIEKKNIKI
jgi:glycosyltransferase EpsF